MTSGFLSLRNVAKRFPNGTLAVDGVSLDVREGEMLSFLGPSGCGKTTLLRLIAGFETPTAGEIWLAGKRLDLQPPNRRGATMVFQGYALFPHLSVFENVAYGLRVRGIRGAALRERVARALDLVGLAGLGERQPQQLSGGQQQRVAVARALVLEPSLLLFDEPLSNLDAKLREQMRLEIRALQRRLGITAVYVTHDQAEAMTLSDRIAVMSAGRIEQVGAPREIYEAPGTRFVADFIGRAAFLPGRVVAVAHGGAAEKEAAGPGGALPPGRSSVEKEAAGPGGALPPGRPSVEVEVLGRRLRVAASAALAPGTRVEVMVRPEAIALRADEKEAGRPGEARPPASAGDGAPGVVAQATFVGGLAQYVVRVDEVRLVVVEPAVPGARLLGEGAAVRVWLRAKLLRAFPV